jgi:hypothetical protein
MTLLSLRQSAVVPRLPSPREAVGRVGEPIARSRASSTRYGEPGWGVAAARATVPPTPDPSPPLRCAAPGEGSPRTAVAASRGCA